MTAKPVRCDSIAMDDMNGESTTSSKNMKTSRVASKLGNLSQSGSRIGKNYNNYYLQILFIK